MTQTSFNTMVSEIPSAVADLTYSIGKIEEQITVLQLEIDDIKAYTLSPMVTASNAYHDLKEIEFTGTLTPAASTGDGYGLYADLTGNLTEWVIVSGGLNIWTSFSISASSSGADLDQYNRQLDYLKVLDHIYRNFDETPIATYGLETNKSGLQTGKTILEADKAKLVEMYPIYSEFVT